MHTVDEEKCFTNYGEDGEYVDALVKLIADDKYINEVFSADWSVLYQHWAPRKTSIVKEKSIPPSIDTINIVGCFSANSISVNHL